MPIYAPSLPPRPDRNGGLHPALVLACFDARRLRTQKLGRFFGFALLMALLARCLWLYLAHLKDSSPAFAGVKPLADQFFSKGAAFQAGQVTGFLQTLLWLQVALLCGGLIARDTLYRIRPLVYAHPVRRRDYLGAKALVAVGLPFLVLALFILVPWGLSLLVAGARGPLWPTLPLYLLPAALVIATLMGAVALAAGSLASSPKGAFGWALGILLGGPALSGILIGITQEPVWKALSVEALAAAWPGLLCGAGPEAAGLGWLPATAGSLAYLGLCTWIAARRTRPEEATL